MPRLIFTGDTTDTFGRHLPTPIIDSITLTSVPADERDRTAAIFEAAETNYAVSTDVVTAPNFTRDMEANTTNLIEYEVKLSIFMNTNDSFNDKELLKDLFDSSTDTESLYLNLIFLRNAETRFQELKESKLNLRSLLATNVFDYDLDKSLAPRILGNIMSEGEVVGKHEIEALYNIYQTLNIDNPVQVISSPLSDFNTQGSAVDSFVGDYDEDGNAIIRICNIFASGYSTELTGLDDMYVLACLSTVSIPEIINLPDVAFALNFSDVSYEQVFKDGNLATHSEPMFIDSNNEFYPNIPIQDLSTKYRKIDNFTPQDMILELANIIAPFETQTSSDSTLRESIENIKSIISLYHNKSDFLARLSRYKDLFPAKSEVFATGRLYVKFRDLITNFNSIISSQEEVVKRIFRNFKIFDQRNVPEPGEFPVASFNESLTADDFAYKVAFQSNIARYSARRSEKMFFPGSPEISDDREMSDLESLYDSLESEIESELDVLWDRSSSGTIMGHTHIRVAINDLVSYVDGIARAFVDDNYGWRCYGAFSGRGDLFREGMEGEGARSMMYNLGQTMTNSAFASFDLYRNPDADSGQWTHYGPGSADALDSSESGRPGFACPWAPDYSPNASAYHINKGRQTGFFQDAKGRKATYRKYTRALKNAALESSNPFIRFWTPKVYDTDHTTYTYNSLGQSTFTFEGRDGGRWAFPIHSEVTLDDQVRNFNRARIIEGDPTLGDLTDYENDYDSIMNSRFDQIGAWQPWVGSSIDSWHAGSDATKLVLLMMRPREHVREYVETMIYDVFANLKASSDRDGLSNLDEVIKENTNWAIRNITHDVKENFTYWWRNPAESPFMGLTRTEALGICDDLAWQYVKEAASRLEAGKRGNRPFTARGALQFWAATPFQKARDEGYILCQMGYDGDTGGSSGYGDGILYGYWGDLVDIADSRAHWDNKFFKKIDLKSKWYVSTHMSEEYSAGEAMEPILTSYLKNNIYPVVRSHIRSMYELIPGVSYDEGTVSILKDLDILFEKRGFVFFDLEKHVRSQSIISRYLDVNSLLRNLPETQEILSAQIGVRKAHLKNNSYNYSFEIVHPTDAAASSGIGSNSDPTRPSELNFNIFGGTAQKSIYARAKVLDANYYQLFSDSFHDTSTDEYNDYNVELMTDGPAKFGQFDIYSTFGQRLFGFYGFSDADLPSRMTWYDDYRLQMYEYRVVMDDDLAYLDAEEDDSSTEMRENQLTRDQLHWEVTVEDGSQNLVFALIESFNEIYNEFYDDYYDVANESCSFNEFTDQFNQYFVDAMTNTYTDSADAPWYKMVSAYVVYADIFTSFFGGSETAMLESADALLAGIRPETGNLAALTSFVEECQRFYDFLEGIRLEIQIYLDTESTSTNELVPLSFVYEVDFTIEGTVTDYIADYQDVAL